MTDLATLDLTVQSLRLELAAASGSARNAAITAASNATAISQLQAQVSELSTRLSQAGAGLGGGADISAVLGVAGGVAPLGQDGLVPAQYLPPVQSQTVIQTDPTLAARVDASADALASVSASVAATSRDIARAIELARIGALMAAAAAAAEANVSGYRWLDPGADFVWEGRHVDADDFVTIARAEIARLTAEVQA